METTQPFSIVAQTALKVSTGVISNQSGEQLGSFAAPKIEILTTPQTLWAQTVDRIEVPFAKEYDQEEYFNNPALTMMGFYELRRIIRSLGVPTPQQEDYYSEPLKGQKCFVVGTGPGREIVWYSIFGASVSGLDATSKYLEIAQRKVTLAQEYLGRQLPVDRLYQCPAESFSWPSKEYDFVSCLFGVLNHVESWEQTLATICNSVKPGGKIFLSMYGQNEALVFELRGQLGYSPSILQRRTEGGILLGESSDILPANFPLPEEVAEVLQAQGFSDIMASGDLALAALFPQITTKKNLELFKSLIAQTEPRLGNRIKAVNDADELLLRTFIYEQKIPRPLQDYAYIRFEGTKV
ncbi:MAG: class I SAM-dependent methyltransferase [Patescibacteria group bacterium]|nr:class I SAM-dependent methyltransferase [Patescibacteria group bacterium]